MASICARKAVQSVIDIRVGWESGSAHRTAFEWIFRPVDYSTALLSLPFFYWRQLMPAPNPEDEALRLARRIAGSFQADPRVKAVTLCGSRTSGAAVDTRSDIDLYVYTEAGDYPPTSAGPSSSAWAGASCQPGADLWANGDVWIDARSGIEVDVFTLHGPIEQELDRPLRRCTALRGYTTLLGHTVRTALILFDRSGWFARLRAWSDQSYPPALRRAIIISHNLPTRIVPSYRDNLEKSLARRDLGVYQQ